MAKNEQPVDFSNPEALAEELAAANVEVKAPKEKKPAKPKVIKIEIIAEKDYAAGDIISFDYEIPKSMGTRGIVAGIPLNEMTDDQLKIEYRNANSVYYKTKKAGKDVTKSSTRLEAVKAKMEERGIQPTARTTAVVDANTVADLIKTGKISIEELQSLLDAQ